MSEAFLSPERGDIRAKREERIKPICSAVVDRIFDCAKVNEVFGGIMLNEKIVLRGGDRLDSHLIRLLAASSGFRRMVLRCIETANSILGIRGHYERIR